MSSARHASRGVRAFLRPRKAADIKPKRRFIERGAEPAFRSRASDYRFSATLPCKTTSPDVGNCRYIMSSLPSTDNADSDRDVYDRRGVTRYHLPSAERRHWPKYNYTVAKAIADLK